MADTACQCVGWQYLGEGYVPGLAALVSLQEPELGPSLKDLPAKLLHALRAPGTKDHEVALRMMEAYVALARTSGHERGQKDLESVIRRTFAPYTEAIIAALARGLDGQVPSVRWKAASVLVAFDPAHGKANAILSTAAEAKEKDFRQACCAAIGELHLSNATAVNILTRLLRDKEPEVRRSAANAVLQIGPEARAAAPALVELLKSGKAAHGRVDTPFRIQPTRSANLALLALGELGAEARLAVPVIVELLEGASPPDQCELLACLAKIGPAARAGRGAIEKAMASADPGVRLTAAFALLSVAPGHRIATSLLNKAMLGADTKLRTQALEIGVETAPRSGVLVPALNLLLRDEDEETRILASHVLGRIGPAAAGAIPALESLLTKEDDHSKHTFVSHDAAASALGHIGKAAVPALVRATATDSGGRKRAIDALGLLGPDAPPMAVECLIRALTEEDSQFIAAIALGQLGQQARSARAALLAQRDNRITGMAVQWALMEISP
jgi:HEAT repeat protein